MLTLAFRSRIHRHLETFPLCHTRTYTRGKVAPSDAVLRLSNWQPSPFYALPRTLTPETVQRTFSGLSWWKRRLTADTRMIILPCGERVTVWPEFGDSKAGKSPRFLSRSRLVMPTSVPTACLIFEIFSGGIWTICQFRFQLWLLFY